MSVKPGQASANVYVGGRYKNARTKTKLNAHLLGTSVPTRAVPYQANVPLECDMCERPIYAGDLFTRAFVPGMGRKHGDLCRGCRPFQVSE